ncbi:hypothetical protein G9U51_00535 [Calidifontibacter sp. DB0510]|uniref:YCII-related domain-containing protein n=1 Tax=Metallococcus carri TaxID=1656884 RepID=A0A967E8J8_9MICO|nr:YciI family protein [Metallococcus carri]NHN54270.1 hypothetical protein [Metallococcus carri]NOP36890.1 hypothetical protein [Calidifontibacter sp. DB2511S]
MKYVILVHSNPQPWGHPTDRFTDEGRAQPESYFEHSGAGFEDLMATMRERGELVTAAALDDPAKAKIFSWTPTEHPVTDGPYAEAAEHLAGFFLIDVASQQRAEEIADRFAQPGGRIELRPCQE